MDDEYSFEREARTPYSESYVIETAQHSIGRVDIHFTSSVAYATLNVHESIDDEAVQTLIAEIDERIVSTADPHREDMIVTVWRGAEIGVFADDPEAMVAALEAEALEDEAADEPAPHSAV